MKSNILQAVIAMTGLAAAHAVEIDAEAQKLIDLKTAPLEDIKLPPQVAVFGSVQPPGPLVELFRQIEIARSELAVSQQTLKRVEDLFSSGELVARKDVESGRAQVTRDQAVIQGLEDKLMLEWGAPVAKLSGEERAKLLDNLLSGKRALIRVSVSRGTTLESAPVSANLQVMGRRFQALPATSIFPSRTVDPAFQAASYLLIVNAGDTPLAAGAIASGSFDLKGEAREGIMVPASAVVFYLGKAWIYQKEKDNDFNRVEISADTPVDGGWFLKKDALEEDPVVIKGGQSILSKETIGAEPAEED